jgi:hypothetical protein
MEENIAALDVDIWSSIVAEKELVSDTLLKFLTLLSTRIRNTFVGPTGAEEEGRLSDDARVGLELRECLNLTPRLKVIRFREILPILANGVVHTLAIMVLKNPDLPSIGTVAYSTTRTGEIPSYALLSSFMYEQMRRGSSGGKLSRRSFTLKRNLPRRSTGNSNVDDTPIEHGHAMSFLTTNGRGWFYRAFGRRELNIVPVNWHLVVHLPFPHFIYPHGKPPAKMLTFYTFDNQPTGSMNADGDVIYRLRGVSVYRPRDGSIEKPTEQEWVYLERAWKSSFVSFYPQIREYTLGTQLLKGLYGRGARHIYVDMEKESTNIVNYLEPTMLDRYREAYHEFVRHTYAVGRGINEEFDVWSDL